MEKIKSKGYAMFSKDGPFEPYEFERHAIGDNDILIKIMYAGICHSDIHQARSEWNEKEHYPMVPGHEIVGQVTQVGKNVTKFKVGDYAGVGCNEGLTAQKAGGIIAKLFGFGNFGISTTDISQKSKLTYGVPSVDAVEGDLVYEAEEVGNFTGHQANAKNITVKAKKELNLYTDLEELESSSDLWKVTGGFNASEFALNNGHSEAWSESQNVKYHPCSFFARESNTFEAPKIYAENPHWKAQKNQIIGQADFVTKYNYSSSKAQAFNLGLSIGFEGGYPSAWLNFGFSRSNNYE